MVFNRFFFLTRQLILEPTKVGHNFTKQNLTNMNKTKDVVFFENWKLTALNQVVLHDIKKSFEEAHLHAKSYYISSATLRNSTTVITLVFVYFDVQKISPSRHVIIKSFGLLVEIIRQFYSWWTLNTLQKSYVCAYT